MLKNSDGLWTGERSISWFCCSLPLARGAGPWPPPREIAMADAPLNLEAAAQQHAALYADDDRQDIGTDVFNAFAAGAKWAAPKATPSPPVAAPPATPVAPWNWSKIEKRIEALMSATATPNSFSVAHAMKQLANELHHEYAAAQPQPQPAQPLTDGSDGVPLP